MKPKVLENAIPSYDWLTRPDYAKENRAWMRKAMHIAITILDELDRRKMTQTQLADKMNVSRQQVSKIVKGHENLTLETIAKIEEALNIKLGWSMDWEDTDRKKKPARKKRK